MILLEWEPGRLCQIISIALQLDGSYNNGVKFIDGIKIRKENEEMEILFDMEKFRPFRIHEKMPIRFNISTPSGALIPRNPWPYRLLIGDGNPASMLFLDLQEK